MTRTSGGCMTRTTPQGCTVPLMHIKHKNPRFTLLFSHGNAEDIGVNKLFCEWLSAQARCVCVCVYGNEEGIGVWGGALRRA